MEVSNSILISVIVPVYNVEAYLDNCIRSIVMQTHRNLEIILVDDGSVDGSGLLCDKWAKADNRIVVFHKKNGGPSDARNYGMKRASGRYVGFVDSDDSIDKNMYKLLLEAALSADADIAMCRIKRCEKSREYSTREYPYSKAPAIFNGKTATEELLHMNIDESNCNKLFKTSLFDNIFYPVGKTNEDFAVLYKLFLRANRIVYIQDLLYCYYRREGSITTQGFSLKQFDKYTNCLEMLHFFENNERDLLGDAKQYLWHQTFRLIKDVYMRRLQNQYVQQCHDMRETLKRGWPEICRSKTISSKEKVMFFAASYFPKLYVWQYALKHHSQSRKHKG